MQIVTKKMTSHLNFRETCLSFWETTKWKQVDRSRTTARLSDVLSFIRLKLKPVQWLSCSMRSSYAGEGSGSLKQANRVHEDMLLVITRIYLSFWLLIWGVS